MVLARSLALMAGGQNLGEICKYLIQQPRIQASPWSFNTGPGNIKQQQQQVQGHHDKLVRQTCRLCASQYDVGQAPGLAGQGEPGGEMDQTQAYQH